MKFAKLFSIGTNDSEVKVKAHLWHLYLFPSFSKLVVVLSYDCLTSQRHPLIVSVVQRSNFPRDAVYGDLGPNPSEQWTENHKDSSTNGNGPDTCRTTEETSDHQRAKQIRSKAGSALWQNLRLLKQPDGFVVQVAATKAEGE